MVAPSPNSATTRDWALFDPVAYLDEYYGDVGDENLSLLRFLGEGFQQLPKGGVMLDFGGGPTIYPLISAANRVDEIHFADYVDSNIEEVRRWIAADPLAFDWDPFILKALELEYGAPCSAADVESRATLIRQRVTRLVRCDASQSPPVSKAHESYDVVLTNFCAESATSEREQWQSYMRNIVSTLKPGGWLLMSALEGASRYSVGPRFFPAVDISRDDLVEALEENGFPASRIEVGQVPADRPTREYSGLLLARAQKGHGSSRGMK